MSSNLSKVGIFGLGLIGGSLAQLIHNLLPSTELWGLDSDPTTVRLAKESMLFEKVSNDLQTWPKNLDLVFICTPLSSLHEHLLTLSAYLEGPVILCDVGSLKSQISTFTPLKPTQFFIPGHPMGGRESTGFVSSSASVLENAPFILCPKDSNSPGLKPLSDFLNALGFRITVLTPSVHDQLVGFVSHFPYLMACLTLYALKNSGVPSELLRAIAGPGLKDETRIGASLPDWGTAIAIGNSSELISALSQLSSDHMPKLKQLIADQNAEGLHSFFTQCASFRNEIFPT